MPYAPEQVKALEEEYGPALQGLSDLHLQLVNASKLASEPRAVEYLLQGVGRRMLVLRDALTNIFEIFPPATVEHLERRSLGNVRINLHAFLINLIGAFDNYAWAYVHQHQFHINPLSVDMFKAKFKQHLPAAIREYVDSDRIKTWHSDYCKNYRDALAHRIAPYVPPGMVSPEREEQYRSLQDSLASSIGTDRYEEIEEELRVISQPCFEFLHSPTDPKMRSVLFHPQVIADTRLVAEFGRIFLEHWLEGPPS